MDPRLGRFTTTDPVIADIWDGQSLNSFSYVGNKPLTFVDPTGFTEEEARRLWRFDEIPGRIGVNVTYDVMPAPTPRPVAPSQSADVGASAPTNDTSTLGTGINASPQEMPGVELAPSQPGLWQGLEDGVVDAFEQLPAMVPGLHESTIAQAITVLEVIDAYKKGDAIDAVL